MTARFRKCATAPYAILIRQEKRLRNEWRQRLELAPKDQIPQKLDAA